MCARAATGSAMEMLSSKVISLIRERGWDSLTEIQEKAIPEVLSGANVLIMAPTGEGKTEAALFPVLSMLVEDPSKPVAVLYITPMKALINDLYQRIEWWASRLGLIVAKKHGDTPAKERVRRLRKVPHILVTTPESLEIDLDWSRKFREHLKNVRWVIVDEIHEFIQSKRGAQLAVLLERLQRLAGRDIQRIGLSATIGDPEWALKFLGGSSKRRGVIVKASTVRKPELRVLYIPEEKGDFWREAARRILEEIEPPSLVFVNSRYAAERLKEALEEIGATDVFVHHSSVATELRLEAEDKLRKGDIKAIVCTKTLEVGIDVGAIKRVIQFRAPGSVFSLLQRVGRSGHVLGGIPKGTIVSVGVADFLEALSEARLALRSQLEPPALRRLPLDVVAKEIVGMALAGGVEVEEAYETIKGTPLAEWITRELFEELLEYMESNRLIKIENGVIKPASTFYKIWRFRPGEDVQGWWVRDFREFFTTIDSSETFTVKYKDQIIGYVDATFVFRYLRVEDTIRLAGKAWEIKRIDANLMRIDVEPATRIAEIPVWRGEGPRRSSIVASEAAAVLEEPSTDGVEASVEGLRELERVRRNYLGRGIPTPSDRVVVYEYYNGEHIFTALLGSGANEALAMVLTHLVSREIGLNVYYRASFMGFSVYAPRVNMIETLKSIDPEEFPELLEAAVRRSPHLQETIRSIQLDLGLIGSFDEYRDELLVEEAVRQVIENYLDVERAVEFLRQLRNGEVEIHTAVTGGLTPLAKEILDSPPVKPWVQDLAERIARLLEDNALTIDEIADILELSPKTVENKIREMRKPEQGETRIVGFIDVDEDEWRWTLLRSLKGIAESPEFERSFKPRRLDNPVKLVIRVNRGDRPRQLLVTPRRILESWDSVSKMLPDEMYSVTITHPDWEGARDDVAVTHYNVPKAAIPLLVLNAAAYIEEKELYYAY